MVFERERVCPNLRLKADDDANPQRLTNKQLFFQNIDYLLGLSLIYVLTLSIFPGFLYENTVMEMINKKLSVSEDATKELLADGKKHAPTWLYGRCPTASRVSSSTNSSTNTYVQELASKIRQDLVSEVESSVAKKVQEEVDAQVQKKVQENMTWVLKKLAEANPGIMVNIEDFCATTSSDDDNGTPMTGGTDV